MISIAPPAMLLSLLVVLLAGYPVAFSLAAVAGVFGMIGFATGAFDAPFLLAMLFRVQGFFGNDNLLAIPMLIFMGVLLERTGLAEDIFRTLNRLSGRLAGGMACGTILVGALLSSLTGFVSASVIAIGLIALPAMLHAKYDERLATGVVAASGTLAQILPPSLVLIVLAEQLEVSLQDIYRGAVVPGLLLIGGYLAYVLIAAWRNPMLAPVGALAPDAGHSRTLWIDVPLSIGTPLLLVGIVLLSIAFGVATPSEGGAIGVSGALLLALGRRRLTLPRLREAMDVTGILCACIIFLLLGASFFTLVFRGFDGHFWVEHLVSLLPAGKTGFVVAVNIVVFLLAFFLDFFEIAFIVLPLIGPIAHKIGVDMVWLTVLLAVNLQASFLHPPFGIALYNLRSVAPRSVPTSAIYWGAVPFIVIQFAVLTMLILFPQLVVRAREVVNGPVDITIPVPETAPPTLRF